MAAIVAAHTSVNYFVITPGDATPVAQFIEVPAADNHPLTGKILLTDVFVTQLNALNYLQYRFLDSDSEVISGGELLGPTVNEDQYLDQGYLQMSQAQSFATASALVPPRLHGHVRRTPARSSTASSPTRPRRGHCRWRR